MVYEGASYENVNTKRQRIAGIMKTWIYGSKSKKIWIIL